MSDDCLQSGMKATEAMVRAEHWWNRKGRFMLKPEFNRNRKAPKNGRGFVIAGELVDVLPSGILRGLAWPLLTREEKLRIVKWWHHWFILVADIENPAISDDTRDMMRRMGIQ